MEIYDQFITPVELTGMIRQALFDLNENTFTLSRILPNVNVADIVASMLTGQQGLAEASVYRSFNAETPIGRREALSRQSFNLAPLGEKIPLDEYHSMRLRHIDADMQGVLEPFIARDVTRLARNIGARFEIARGDALYNGKVTINENGVYQVLDFGRSSDCVIVLGTTSGYGPKWTNHDTSTPINDLLTATQAFYDKNGRYPEAIHMPKAMYLHMVQSVQIRNQVLGQFVPSGAASPLISNDQANAALSAFDIPPIILDVDQTTKVVNSSGVGVVTRITPANKFLLTAPGETLPGEGTSLGATFLGQTAESSLAEYGLAGGDQPGIVAANWYSKDPVTYWTHAAALGIPVLREPNLAFTVEAL
jgi:hypothetical protein